MTEQQHKTKMELHIDVSRDAMDADALIPEEEWEATQERFLDALDELIQEEFKELEVNLVPSEEIMSSYIPDCDSRCQEFCDHREVLRWAEEKWTVALDRDLR